MSVARSGGIVLVACRRRDAAATRPTTDNPCRRRGVAATRPRTILAAAATPPRLVSVSSPRRRRDATTDDLRGVAAPRNPVRNIVSSTSNAPPTATKCIYFFSCHRRSAASSSLLSELSDRRRTASPRSGVPPGCRACVRGSFSAILGTTPTTTTHYPPRGQRPSENLGYVYYAS